MCIRLRELTSASCQSMAHIAIQISESLVSLNVKVDELNKNLQVWKNQTATSNDSSNESIGTTFEHLKDILNQITVPTNHLQILRRDRKDFWNRRL